MKIEVTEIQKSRAPARCQVGRASVRVGDVLIHDWQIIQESPRKAPRVLPPDRGDGTAMIEFPDHVFCAIQKRILLAWGELVGVMWR